MSPKPKAARKKSSKGKQPLPPSQSLNPTEEPTENNEQEETRIPSLLRRASSAVSSAETAVASGSLVSTPLPLPEGLSDYIIAPGGPLLAHWDNAVNPSILGTFFEPQGELTSFLARQRPHSLFDFELPVHIAGDSPYQTTALTSVAADPPEPPEPPDLDFTDISTSAAPPTIEADMSTATRSLKRKATTESAFATPSADAGSSTARRPSKRVDNDTLAAQQPGPKRRMSRQSVSGQTEPPTPVAEATPSVRLDSVESQQPEASSRTGPSSQQQQAQPGPSATRHGELTARLNPVLPVGKVFPIRIGAQLFHLSGGSISSDAPSYFSQYFAEQLLQSGGRSGEIKTLYIDRDPTTFHDIVLHLQGYHIKPRDGTHYVKLFADAQYYSLPRLTRQLYKSDIFIQVGERHFQIPRSLISSPGDLPNFFSLGFARAYAPPEAIPSAEGQALRRPPAIRAPVVANRDGDRFAELFQILQGYDVHIRDEEHRVELLRDARYFHLKGVEQKLLPCELSYNLERRWNEITMRLEDLRQSGITFLPDDDDDNVAETGAPSSSTAGPAASSSKPATSPHSAPPGATFTGTPGWIRYQRPYIDDGGRHLVVDVGGAGVEREETTLDLRDGRASLAGSARAHVSSLFGVVASKMGVPTSLPLGAMLVRSGGGVAALPPSPASSGLSGDRVRFRIARDAHVELDGQELVWEEEEDGRGRAAAAVAADDDDEGGDDGAAEREEKPVFVKWKRQRGDASPSPTWIVPKALWRLRIEVERETGKAEVVLCAVKMIAYSAERARNKKRRFL